MLKDSSTKRKKKFTLENLQQYLTYFLLFTLPLCIMPFPWDWTERGMSLLILLVVTIIVGIEVVKLIWKGKMSILKSVLDIGLFILILSMLISTLFSVDFYSSLWGIDGRLGGSFIIFLSLIIFSFTVRNYIKTWEEVKKGIYAFLIGFGINNILSAISFFGINVWGFLPVFRDLHQAGLPLLRSAKLHLFVNFINMILLLGVYVSNFFAEKKSKIEGVLQIVFLIFSILNVIFFSINQGFSLVVMFVASVGVFLWLLTKKMKLSKKENKSLVISSGIAILALIVPIALLQIPQLREVIIPPNLELVTQLSLGTDVSWMVSSSVLVDSLWRGLIGMGVDTFSIAFNMFKPINQNLLNLNDVNFYYAGNDLFTKFANGGLVWLGAWFFFGYLIYKLVSRDYKELKSYKNNGLGGALLVLDFMIVFIYLASIFATYSVLILFLLLIAISFSTILRNVLRKDNTDKFVIKLWTMDLNTDSGSDASSLNVFLTIVTVIVCAILLGFWGTKSVSSAYLLKAESYFVEQSNLFAGNVYPTIEQRDGFITQMSDYYSNAVALDRGNPLMNRKDGLMSLEKVGIAAEKYSQAGEDADTDALLKDVGLWKNYAIDSTRRSIDTSVYVYDNWEARVRTYMGLIGLGFNDYTADAIYSIDKAAELKPSNFNLYYSKAQIYVINGEQDNALGALEEVLRINGQHVSSLMLSAEINRSKGNTDVAESYLKAAKKILESVGETSTEAYQAVVKQLNDLGSTLENTSEDGGVQIEDAQTSVSE